MPSFAPTLRELPGSSSQLPSDLKDPQIGDGGSSSSGGDGGGGSGGGEAPPSGAGG